MQLADTSAWSWSRRAGADLREHFDALLVEGEIAICDMVKLELLHSARNGDEFSELAEELESLTSCPIGDEQWKRALQVYGELARLGGSHQRSVKHADLLIAAAAEVAGFPVLHYDEDYVRIAEITGQPHDWLAPPGSLS